MIKTITVALLLMVGVTGLHAQSKPAQHGWKFHSLNQVGLLNGKNVTAFHLQSVNGFRRNNMFAGIGVGLDFDRYRSVPLFADIRKYFGKKGGPFFVYADGGVNFVWQKRNSDFGSTERFLPGFYSNYGIGYKSVFENGASFIVSAGYSYKRISHQTMYTVCMADGACMVQTNTDKYDFNRLVIQIGWMF